MSAKWTWGITLMNYVFWQQHVSNVSQKNQDVVPQVCRYRAKCFERCYRPSTVNSATQKNLPLLWTTSIPAINHTKTAEGLFTCLVKSWLAIAPWRPTRVDWQPSSAQHRNSRPRQTRATMRMTGQKCGSRFASNVTCRDIAYVETGDSIIDWNVSETSQFLIIGSVIKLIKLCWCDRSRLLWYFEK